jgi:hypothetical protein
MQRKAAEIYKSDNPEEEFNASRGWLNRFFSRHGFTLQRHTTVGQRLPAELVLKVVSFLIQIRRMISQHGFPLSQIGNMDETRLWADMPGETTVEHVRARSIPL